MGSYYSAEEKQCVPCPQGEYQDREGQMACRKCPQQQSAAGGILGARNISECGGESASLRSKGKGALSKTFLKQLKVSTLLIFQLLQNEK